MIVKFLKDYEFNGTKFKKGDTPRIFRTDAQRLIKERVVRPYSRATDDEIEFKKAKEEDK